MPTRHVLAACLLACGSAALWWWSATPCPPPDPRVGTTGALVTTRTSPQTDDRDAHADDAVVRTAPDPAHAGATVRLVVVDAADLPVASAEVRYWPPRSEAVRRADQERRETAGDLEAALQATGLRATTDAHGCVEIVADADSAGCARSGEAYGEFDLAECATSELREVRVTLRRDVALRIEVVDSLARPVAGRMVTVTAQGVSANQGSAWAREELGPTDATGTVVLPHVLHALDLDDRVADGLLAVRTARRDSDAHTVVLAQQHVQVTALQRETTVRLTIPAGGTIVLQAKDADGAPADCSVWLLDDHGDAYDLNPTWAADEYTFHNVPCGRHWSLVVSDGGMMVGVIDNIVLPVIGPRTEDEVVRVAVDVPTRTWRLRCRLVRKDGRPLADAKITATSRALGGALGARSDEQGLVDRWYLREKATVTDLAPLELRIESPFCRPTSITVERPIPSGTIDLGEFVVDPPVGETVLASVELRAAGRPAPPGGGVRLLCKGGEPIAVSTWASEVDGVLHLHGVPPPGPMLLSCWHARFVSPAWQPIRVGEHRVVDLQPAASLQVAVLATGLPLDEVQGSLTRLGDEDSDDEPCDSRQQAIRWPHLAPGRYGLRITLGDLVLHEAASIELLPGGNRWPADGTRVDVRGKVKVRRIAARSARDEARIGPDLLLVEAAATSLPEGWEDQIVQAAWYPIPERPHDVLVRAWQHVPVRLPSAGPDLAIRMQPCTRVDFDTEAAARHDAVRVRIVANAVTDPLLRAFDCHRHDAEFDVKEAGDRLFAPGTELDVCLVRDGKPGPPQRVVVGTSSPQPVVLR